MAEGAKHPTASERSERSCDHHLSAEAWLLGWCGVDYTSSFFQHRGRATLLLAQWTRAKRSGEEPEQSKPDPSKKDNRCGLCAGIIYDRRGRVFCFWLNGRERSEAEKSQSRRTRPVGSRVLGGFLGVVFLGVVVVWIPDEEPRA